MLQILFELLLEFLLQVFGELLIELGFHSLAQPFKDRPDPRLLALGYTLLGLIGGGLSLLLIPDHWLQGGWRWLNLLLTPILLGGMMGKISLRPCQIHAEFQWQRFACGLLFALTFGLIRHFYAN